jgi:hypothetical protein
MSAETLPYALLILLVEFAVGCLWLTVLSHVRGNSVASFVKFGAGMAFTAAGITFITAAALSIGDEVDGYPLEESLADPLRWSLGLLFAASGLYAYATLREHRVPALVFGAAASFVGIAVIAFLSGIFAIPAWGYPLVFVSLTLGALAVGAVTMAMTLGHWYLVTPRLPEQPLREMTFICLSIIVVQGLMLVLSLALPRDSIGGSVDTPILQNPFFWMRIGAGIVFPAVLVWMAYDSSGVRAMQSATGLLYIAMAFVLVGEVMAKGLLLASAVPN